MTELTGLVVLIANAGELIPGLLGPRHSIDPGDGSSKLLVIAGRTAFGATRGALELLLRSDGPHGDVGAPAVRTPRPRHGPNRPSRSRSTATSTGPVGWMPAIVPGALTLLVPATAN